MSVFCNSKGSKIDILTLSETHTLSHNSEVNFLIRGFNFISRSRRNGSEGGVAMNVSEKINFSRREDLESDNIECN